MKVCRLFLLLIIASCLWAAPIVNMQYLSATGSPGFYLFNVNGSVLTLVCDQFLPNVSTLPYQAFESTLDDLTETVLFKQNDPEALKKYQQVAILDLLAYADPTNAELVAAVTWANRRIVDGSGPLTPLAQSLFDWVQTENPADYDLTSFRIYTSAPDHTFAQEQTYHLPEPATIILLGAGLWTLVLLRRRVHS